MASDASVVLGYAHLISVSGGAAAGDDRIWRPGSGGWPAALGVVVAYVVIITLMRVSRAQAAKQAAVQVISTPPSDAEKIHMSQMKERDQRMAERCAKFPP